jgi:hypothetical protein
MRKTILMKGFICALLLLEVLCLGCRRREIKLLQLICIVDLTASIDPKAQGESFAALEAIFLKLKRGDTVTLIPITGDSLTEAQGHVLRFHLSEKREAYDADLKRLAEEAQKKLQRIKEQATAKPYMRSDILGAAALAGEELSMTPAKARKIVVILSDFIQDDAQHNFNRDSRLASDQSGKRLAKTLAQPHEHTFQETTVYMGLLRSSDLKSLPQGRRSAIRTFWTEYFSLEGAESVHFTSDGPGQLAQFLQRSQESKTQQPDLTE